MTPLTFKLLAFRRSQGYLNPLRLTLFSILGRKILLFAALLLFEKGGINIRAFRYSTLKYDLVGDIYSLAVD